MIAKELLVKGMAGLAAIGGSLALAVGYKKGYFSFGDGELKELIEKVGLSCDLANAANGVVCTKKEGNDVKVNVKHGETKFEVSTIPSSGGANIKLYRLDQENGYHRGLKFVVDGGEISGTDNGNKLEEFETYQIEEVTETDTTKHYLSRKTKVSDKMEGDLILPTGCKLPDSSSTTCDNVTQEQLQKINFEGKTSASVGGTNGTVKLTITKLTDEDFPHGYKFGFQAKGSEESSITIGSEKTTLKQGKDTEFRLKKRDDKTFTLEKAWTLGYLTEKVGMECTAGDSSECSLKAGKKLNLKKGESNKTEHTLTASNVASGAKIKLYSGSQATDHENEFKFVIEGGDITLNGSSTKLEQFETYEIKKDDGDKKWYLSMKDSAGVGRGKALGLPDTCNLSSTSPSCSDVVLDTEKLKKINFEGKGNNDALSVDSAADLKLTVTKETGENVYTDGYRFVFKTSKDVTVNGTDANKNIVFKKGADLEFKIKKGSGNTLTLEKAWTVTTLGAKVGLNCEASSTEKKCSFKDDGTINVKNGDNDKIEGAKVKDNQSNTKKISYEEGQEDHNQGIRFFVDGTEDICLQKDSDESKKIEKKTGSGGGSGETYYEIKKDGSTWYLVKKSSTPG